MVELPEGRMKSREGTVVDADDLMFTMIETARAASLELGKLDGLPADDAATVYRQVALGALKYFILKVDPKKTMMFNPRESIDFNGNTGPFIQYTHARVRSLERKAAAAGIVPRPADPRVSLTDKERDLIKLLARFPSVVSEAGATYSPALLANHAYDLAKEFNQFYHDYPILKEGDDETRNARLLLAVHCGAVIRAAMALLGIEMPERM
jgi:arginyl-tRNA synthetase